MILLVSLSQILDRGGVLGVGHEKCKEYIWVYYMVAFIIVVIVDG